ncbi:hypothetical protein RDI58_004155 [Solanum bulbocastanum]|uniref:Uncharacterized protein n=1 Tax=Solanum bulbocastanum TaxID=147425 RepID=A0AAN8U0N4_SOLBU
MERDNQEVKENVNKGNGEITWVEQSVNETNQSIQENQEGRGGDEDIGGDKKDEKRDLIDEEGTRIKTTTNTITEARAILKARKHCKNSQFNQVASRSTPSR